MAKDVTPWIIKEQLLNTFSKRNISDQEKKNKEERIKRLSNINLC